MQANPVGEQVVAGAAGFERVGGALTITQGTDRAVINWNSFSIGAGEITKFVQPNSSSAVLNRVITANNPSAIYGTLQANGQVYLINPAGIFIGPGGLVDTASFVASTHDVGDKEFMGGGDLNFTGSSGASIINQGRIEAKQGDVFLVARQVSNEGQIMASDGTVGMISGTEVCLHSIGPNNYKVRLIDVANDTGVQKTDNGIADVVNAGVIEAANAELESTGNYLSLAIKNTGVIRATGVMANADGSVTLTGGEGDILNTGVVAAIQKNIQGETVGGRILASAKNITTDPGSIMTAAGTEKGGEIRLAAKDTVYASGKVEAGSTAGKGGKVQVTGERVALIQAEVDVSGKTGGGTVMVGGDYLGKNPEVPNAKAVVMTSDSVIRANATENGDGGKVILWSDEYTGFYGEIFARGGIESGNGGFVETSSKDNLQAFGAVIASAVNGQGGLWLLDPSNVLISTVDSANGSFATVSTVNTFTPNNTGSAIVDRDTIQTSLNAGTSVTILTSSTTGGQSGDISMSAGISKTGGGAATLTMIAAGSINISQSIISETASNALTLVLGAGSNVTIGANITTNGGNLLIQGSNTAGSATTTSAATVTLDGGTVSTGSGNLSIVATGAIIQSGGTLSIGGTSTVTTGNATISLNQANDFIGAVSLINTENNNVAVTDANAIVLGTSSVGTGTFTITAGGSITQVGGITQAGIAGAATFNAGAGVISLTQANNFTGAVSLNNSGANNVTVRDINAIILGTSLVGTGTLAVNASGANSITQTGTITQAAGAGVATFTTGAGVITLTQANDFTGAVSLNNSGANNVSVTDSNMLTLGTLNITAGNLTALSTGALNLGQGTVGGSLAATSNGGDISQTGGLTMGTSNFNAGTGSVTLTAGLGGAAQNSFGGAVSMTAGDADFYMASGATGVDRLAQTAGSTVVTGTFTLRSPLNTDFNLAKGVGLFKLTSTQLANMNVGTLAARASGTGDLLVGTFNTAGVNALNLITAGTGNITADSITVRTLGLISEGTVAFMQPNQVRNLGALVVESGGFTFQNQTGINLTGFPSMPGRFSLELVGQFNNQTGVENPLANVAGGSVIKSLSLMEALPNSIFGLPGFSYRYDGVTPTSGNVMSFAVSPLAQFAPSGTTIAGVDLSGTQTGGGQFNTFLTGSDDLNWIISDFGKFNLPKVSLAGLEYTIYPQRVEPETRTLPDSTLSQLRKELGRPPTIEEINRREVSMRQSDRLRSGSILERSSLDSAEESNEPQENAKATTPSPIEGQVPQANQVPKKATPPDNGLLETLPPVATWGRLPSGSVQRDQKGAETVRELLMKERASAEVDLSIPVANTQ